MKIDVTAVRKTLKAFDFKTLFYEHLGWDKHTAHLDIPVGDRNVQLDAIAQKRGFVAFVCDSIPDRQTRLKIDHQVTKSVREHFVIYADEPVGQQVWHWVRRETGKPLASRDHRFDVSQSGDPLIQRLEHIAVSMVEEEALTLPDIAGRGRAAFDVDKVTKKFYERFKAEHSAFLKLIKGFPAPVRTDGKTEPHPDLQWYTSLMLNRLMFVYFMQKKGFLDGDTDYLRHRLAMVQQARGKDKFQSFYRYFLLRLFHDGLGTSLNERNLEPVMKKLLGKIPFLNGGFFEVHKLETEYPDIDIPDEAFEKLFDFFDLYSWHLDERPCRADNEINPDVVGYIFEKYINQKQMGAYYTKEDITEYISKNTIIPYLFDAAQKKCSIAFKPDSALWRLLQDDPDRYIYPAVGHGVTCDYDRVNHRDHKRRSEPLSLPPEIEAGIKDVSKRDGWNKTAPESHALPTETWREVVARRQRCIEMREKLSKGEVQEINELITLNLDIWQFARDAIVNAEGPELLRAFWRTLVGRIPEKSNEQAEPGITILDPTCGSGAFLFAALRILETLYSDCLERMGRFIEDAEHSAPSTPEDEVRRLIAAGEGATVEFKSSARWDIKENRHNPALEEVIVKTVAGFMNTHGGTLLIGVSDNGTTIGLERDYHHTRKDNPSRDQFELWITKRLMKELGKSAKPCFHVDFALCDGADVCRVTVYKAADPVFVEKNGQDVLYVRDGNATNPRTKSSEILAYKEHHWPAGQSVPRPPAPPVINSESLKRTANAKRAFEDFRKTLARISEHRGERYFILKSIIINNLFGVDIMEEAVEICKLRLFLKLVAQVEPDHAHPHYGLEPLPDIDFNIRAGNTLVGFATLDQVRKSQEGTLGFGKDQIARIEEEAELVDRSFQQFRAQQVKHGGKVTAKEKQELITRLAKLDDELDRYLASEYGINIDKRKEFDEWKNSHQPFHWFVEFYGIMHAGGFDVIIGNPPYITTHRVTKAYRVLGLETVVCPDIYACFVERSLALLCQGGRSGLITPVSLSFSTDFAPLRKVISLNSPENWYSSFARIPAALFSAETRVRNTIWIAGKTEARPSTQTTRLHRWFEEARPTLFQSIEYAYCTPGIWGGTIPKAAPTSLVLAFEKHARASRHTIAASLSPRPTRYILYWKKTAYNWLNCCRRLPPSFDAQGKLLTDVNYGQMYFADAATRDLAFVVLNASLLFLYWCIRGDDLNVPRWVYTEFPLDLSALPETTRTKLLNHADTLERAMMEATSFKLNAGKRVGNYNLAKCRAVTRQIDKVVYQAMGLEGEVEALECLYGQMVKTDFENTE